MARIRMNTEDVGDGPVTIDPGKYRAKLMECEEEESSSGNPMLVWQWEIAEGDFIGNTIKSWTSLQDHALFGLKEHMEAFGFSGELDVDTDKLIGKFAILTIGRRKIKDRDTGEDKEVSSIVKVSAAPKAGGSTASGKKGKGGKMPF